MHKARLAAVTLVSSLLGVTTALAASDYFLKIEGVEGESSAAPPQPIEVSSYSFGVSNAGSAAMSSGGGTGKVSMQDLSVTTAAAPAVVAPRDAASGLPTGKRSKSPASAPAASPSTEPVAGTGNTLSLLVPSSGSEAAKQLYRMCASGKHIKRATLTAGAKTYELHDVVVSSCDEQGGQREYKFKTGHVTLIK